MESFSILKYLFNGDSSELVNGSKAMVVSNCFFAGGCIIDGGVWGGVWQEVMIIAAISTNNTGFIHQIIIL
jgi:hypothetical protein